MTQVRFHNYKRPVVSFDENQRLMGIIKSGRYAGFDTMTNVSGLSFEIAHTKTGVIKSKVDLTQTPRIGVIVTPQGTIINEDANLALSVDTNAGNANIRVDLIVYTHNHVIASGGAAATVSIIKGALGSFTKPALPSPAIQTVIGMLLIPANAANLNTATYLAATHPDERRKRPEFYSGLVSDIPAGKVLCDGVGFDTDLSPIPNLKGKFIVGYDAADADYNVQAKLGPKVPVSGDPEFAGYEVIGLGKFIKQKAKSVGPHKHYVAYSYETWVEISNNWQAGGGASPGNGTGRTDPITATGISGLNLYEISSEVTDAVPMENRPPYYTMAYIIPV